MNRIINGLIFLLPFCGLSAFAQTTTPVTGTTAQGILVNAPPPATQYIFGNTGYNLYFAASNGPQLNGGEFYLANSFRLIDVSDYSQALIYLDISSNLTTTSTTGQNQVITLGVASSAGDEIPLYGASVVDQTVNNQAPAPCTSTSNCIQGVRTGSNPYLSAFYSPGTVMRVSFRLSDLCATTGIVANAGAGICPADYANNFISGITNLSQQIYVSISNLPAATSAAPNPIGDITASPFSTTIYLTDVPPTLSRPNSTNVEDFYYPADGSILINADNFGLSAGTADNGTVCAPPQNLVVLADLSTNSTPVINSNGLPGGIASLVSAAGSSVEVDGFTNSTCEGTTCTPAYNGAFYAMNSAGIFSIDAVTVDASNPLPQQGTISADGLLHAEAVNSVLTKSKCFIATAAFHDGDAGPVKMLRKFRDRILAKSKIGQDFIQSYYKYSPPLAAWAWDKPIIRSIALHALAPVEFMAWAILKLTHAEEISSQPYIDRVKKKLDADDPNHTASESYIDSVKKKLPPEPSDTESYSEKEKRKLLKQEVDPTLDYSKKAKAELPPEADTESTITKVKEGRDKRPEPIRPPITTAFSAKFGLSPGVKVTNTDPNSVDFQDMYGNGSAWQPDLVLHYERQLVHSETWGSFGLQADLGLSYAEGYGQYQYGFGSQDSKTSKTKFSFLQIPITVGGIYRFNLAKLFRPYVGVGIGSMFYTEIRSDDKPDRHGETPSYTTEAGLAFEIDAFDKRTAQEGFLSGGIQHTYLFAEFMHLGSFASSGVTFERNGLYLGFLVEY